MTTVDTYRSTQLELPSDVPSNARRPHPSPNTITRNYIPPAVPSPPRESAQQSPPRRPVKRLSRDITIKMASEESSQWLFTDSELASTPSMLDGLPSAEERGRRAKGVNFIIQAGILLKLPQLTLATASVFFHRFYMRQSMVVERGGLHHYLPRSKSHAMIKAVDLKKASLTFQSPEQNIAATSLFLATKTEENCRKTKEIVIAVAKVAQKNASLIIDEQTREYWRWRDNILLYEELMLELLTFDVVLQSPYTFLYDFLQLLRVEDNKQLRNVAWAFLNDSCLTMMCLLMSPKDIAIASIYFAAKFTNSQISDDEKGNTWWEQLGGRPDMISKAVGVMNEFYSENPLKRNENPYEQSPSSVGIEEDLERTRGRNEGFRGETPASQDGNSRNGHHEAEGENGTPVLNGNKSDHHSTNGNEKDKHPEAEPLAAPPSSSLANGSSDAPLKQAANDPTTHIENAGMVDLLPTGDEPISKTSPKRKDIDDSEEPTRKRPKIDSEESQATGTSAVEQIKMTDNADESEEGELEE